MSEAICGEREDPDIAALVMRGLDPRIHHLRMTLSRRMDGRVKPGHDACVIASK
jgi:hypothetical protein